MFILGRWRSNFVGTLIFRPDDCGFQGLNRMLTLIQAGHGIDVEIHAQAVTELIGHELGINARLSTETGMRTPHRLKGGPVESDGF